MSVIRILFIAPIFDEYVARKRVLWKYNLCIEFSITQWMWSRMIISVLMKFILRFHCNSVITEGRFPTIIFTFECPGYVAVDEEAKRKQMEQMVHDELNQWDGKVGNYSPNMYWPSTEPILKIHETCSQHPSDMYSFSTQHLPNMYWTLTEHVLNIHRTCTHLLLNTQWTFIQHQPNMHSSD